MRSDSPLPERIDRYEIDSLLGVGAFAAVYRAIDPALDHAVALKVLGDHHSADPDLRERFVREARLMRRLSDGSQGRLVAVHDIGEWQHQPFIVMEAFGDGTLADWLDERPPLAPDSAEARWLIDEISACLRVVHAAGVAHRDVKPSNFLLRRDDGGDETLVLGDFGLARELDASHLTVAGGTDHYMAPEQRSPGADIDARADIHAASVLIADALDLSPGALDARLRRGRAPDPDDRPPDVDHWQAELFDAIDRPGQYRFHCWKSAAAVGLVVACLVVGVLTALFGGGSEPAPLTVDGPTQLVLGDIGVYRHDDRDGADYRWEDAQGRTFGENGADSVEIKPVDTGVYELTLIETIDGAERSTLFEIDVVAP